MANRALFLTTEDPYAIYGPSEKVRGTANIDVASVHINIKYVIASLVAGSRISGPGSPKSVKSDIFHKQSRMLYQNKRGDPAKKLSKGTHKWEFEFLLPSANDLPPSFYYKDEDGTAEVVYHLVMYVHNLKETTKENIATLTIQYFPKRSPSIIADETLVQFCQPLLVKRYQNEVLFGRKKHRLPHLVNRLTQRKAVEEQFLVTLWIPRYASFMNHLDMSLRVQTADKNPFRVVEVRLTKVEYRVVAFTRIAHDQKSRTSQHCIQSDVRSCSSLLEINSQWISLQRHAPFRVQPKVHGMPLDKTTISTLGPSFATNRILRGYSLDVDIFLRIYAKVYRVRFGNNELILLPHESHIMGD